MAYSSGNLARLFDAGVYDSGFGNFKRCSGVGDEVIFGKRTNGVVNLCACGNCACGRQLYHGLAVRVRYFEMNIAAHFGAGEVDVQVGSGFFSGFCRVGVESAVFNNIYGADVGRPHHSAFGGDIFVVHSVVYGCVFVLSLKGDEGHGVEAHIEFVA